jgi:hypothetical protein
MSTNDILIMVVLFGFLLALLFGGIYLYRQAIGPIASLVASIRADVTKLIADIQTVAAAIGKVTTAASNLKALRVLQGLVPI